MNPQVATADGDGPYPSPLTAPQLLQACRAGDEEAWQDLLDQYEPQVYAIPLHYGLPAEEAGAITQIVFTALLQSLDSWQESSNLDRWLVLVARRHSWRALRCRQRITDTELNANPMESVVAASMATGARIPTAPAAVYAVLLQRFTDYVQYRQQPDRFQRQQVTLTLNSLHQPHSSGMRAGEPSASRHYLYANDQMDVTLFIQASRQGTRCDLIGQLLPNTASLLATPFVAQLVQQGQEVAITLTDIVGGFYFARLKPGNYDLLFSTDRLEIELPNFTLAG